MTGEYEAPDQKSPLFSHKKCVSDMIITWILNTLSDKISSNMHYLDSDFDVWSELSERFLALSGHKI